jgi:hypothetical protein
MIMSSEQPLRFNNTHNRPEGHHRGVHNHVSDPSLANILEFKFCQMANNNNQEFLTLAQVERVGHAST